MALLEIKSIENRYRRNANVASLADRACNAFSEGLLKRFKYLKRDGGGDYVDKSTGKSDSCCRVFSARFRVTVALSSLPCARPCFVTGLLTASSPNTP